MMVRTHLSVVMDSHAGKYGRSLVGWRGMIYRGAERSNALFGGVHWLLPALCPPGAKNLGFTPKDCLGA